MTVLFFGTYDTKTTPRIQGMIDGLRAHRVVVHECNVPLKLSTAERVAMLRQPWRLPLLMVRLSRCWLRLIKLSRRTPATDAIIVGHLGHFDIHLARRLFSHKPILLDYMISGSATAKDRQASGGLKHKLLVWLDTAALKTADVVIVDTEEHRQALPDAQRPKGVVVNVGAPETWFAAARPTETDDPEPAPVSVIFFGNFIPLQGTSTIGEAIGLLREPVKMTMVGTGQDYLATKQAAAKNTSDVTVTWIDWVDAAELPQLVASHDICLGIFGTSSKALQVVPNKVYQGAAVGCAVVTSDTPPQRRLLKDAAVYVPVGDAPALARAIDDLARDPAKLHELRRAAYQVARASFTPQQITTPLVSSLQRLVADQKPV